MTKTTRENTRLGILVILGTVFLVIAAYLIGNNQNLFNKTFSINAMFNNVNGLQEGNNVRFSGINAGTVKSIEMVNDSTIKVIMLIKDDLRPFIKKDAIATIGSDGLVGNMIVNILPGKDAQESVKEGDQIRSYSRIGAEDLLNTLSVTNENAALLTADLLRVTESLTEGKGTLGMLLNDTIMANDLKQSVANFKLASNKANNSFEDLNELLGNIDVENSVAAVFLNDSISGEKVRSVIGNMEKSSTSLDSVLINLNNILEDIKQGKGMVNYLITDTVMVRQLEATMKNIEQGTDRFNQNMEALRDNILFRRYFRKLEKQQQKENN